MAAEEDLQISDAFLRHQARLEGFAEAVAARMASEVRMSLDVVEDRLGDASGFTRARLVRVQGELKRLMDNLSYALSDWSKDIGLSTMDAVPGVIEEAARVVRSASLAPLPPVNPSDEAFFQVFARPFEGKSWTTWSRKIASDVTGRVQSELALAEALGEGIPAIAARLQTVQGLAQRHALAHARTLVNDIGNRARVAQAEEQFGDLIQGWRYLATLDGRTSKICAALDGRTWRRGEEGIQRPPLHPNCRSILVPLTDPTRVPQGVRPAVADTRTPKQREKDFRREAKDRAGLPKWRRISERSRRDLIRVERARWRTARVGQVSADTNFESWLSRQPADFQRDFLGPTRFRAFRRGLPFDAMATTSRSLSIEELIDRYPNPFAGDLR